MLVPYNISLPLTSILHPTRLFFRIFLDRSRTRDSNFIQHLIVEVIKVKTLLKMCRIPFTKYTCGCTLQGRLQPCHRALDCPEDPEYDFTEITTPYPGHEVHPPRLIHGAAEEEVPSAKEEASAITEVQELIELTHKKGYASTTSGLSTTSRIPQSPHPPISAQASRPPIRRHYDIPSTPEQITQATALVEKATALAELRAAHAEAAALIAADPTLSKDEAAKAFHGIAEEAADLLPELEALTLESALSTVPNRGSLIGGIGTTQPHAYRLETSVPLLDPPKIPDRRSSRSTLLLQNPQIPPSASRRTNTFHSSVPVDLEPYSDPTGTSTHTVSLRALPSRVRSQRQPRRQRTYTNTLVGWTQRSSGSGGESIGVRITGPVNGIETLHGRGEADGRPRRGLSLRDLVPRWRERTGGKVEEGKDWKEEIDLEDWIGEGGRGFEGS
ncbi:MAG: hypothetical protein MMC33_008388 [Icmadophila ericetorum]|nr:hypothetical protein [Icmadophila ericetorum]